MPTGANYVVVLPPIDAVVYELPGNVNSATVKGTKYFVFVGAYYQPFYSGGAVIYMIVKDPTMG